MLGSWIRRRVFWVFDFLKGRPIRKQYLDIKRMLSLSDRDLLEEQSIKGIDSIQPTLSAEIGNDVPLYLPVYVAPSRKDLQTYMAANRVYCPIIWPKPVQVDIVDDETTKLGLAFKKAPDLNCS